MGAGKIVGGWLGFTKRVHPNALTCTFKLIALLRQAEPLQPFLMTLGFAL